jgi:hypothetical protein
MKIEHLLLIGAAGFIGFQLAKKRTAQTSSTTRSLMAPPVDAASVAPVIVNEIYTDDGYGYGPSWGWGTPVFGGGRRGGGHGHGHGGHHGGHH